MRVGMMNDPRRDACDEARWAAEHGFDFLDLTIEGPAADLDQLDVPQLKAILTEHGLGLVGHTAWYLPFASPHARVRAAAVACACDTFATFAEMGATWVNVHIQPIPRLFPSEQMIAWNIESFAAIVERARPYGLRVMAENTPLPAIYISDMEQIFAAVPELGFHFDIGHASIGGDRVEGMLKAFADRLAHVHVSDNRGRSDDHTALGAGTIDYPKAMRLLREYGYDGTITLEVFTPDRDYLLLSTRKLREWWDAARA
ncbi:MAG: sugar phosphate isomerase/epimerase [Chloroflexaceae bacterium]|nr:sugar phosphate isomerase/epimerase [Chloroflexaceae bacterium]